MALFHPFSGLVLVLFSVVFFSSMAVLGQEPVLDSVEKESVYRVLESINSEVPWRSLFPDDLCSSAPHGVVCDYFSDSSDGSSPETVHITELNFGYVSDFTPNPPCFPNSTINPVLFTSFKFLRKLFFYKCFNNSPVSVPDVLPSFTSTLEELVFVDNPSLVGPMSGILRNFTNLRRVVLTGNGVYGKIPDVVGDLANLEELTLSRNQLSGEIPSSLSMLKKLKILDLSHNFFDGSPTSIGKGLSELLKLDLSSNRFSGQIPVCFKAMKKLEFLDLSFNHFGNFGVPLFLSEMPRLREVYMSGNQLGGQIPEIWENLGGVLRLGFSDMGLVGKIPASMGVHLKSLCYLGLHNNKLEGSVPEEFSLLEFIGEINLENNSLSGKISVSRMFSTKIGQKMKLEGNPELCVDDSLSSAKNSSRLGRLKVCKKPAMPNPVPLIGSSPAKIVPFMFIFMGLLFVFLSA